MSGCVMCVGHGRVHGDVKEQKLKVKMKVFKKLLFSGLNFSHKGVKGQLCYRSGILGILVFKKVQRNNFNRHYH